MLKKVILLVLFSGYCLAEAPKKEELLRSPFQKEWTREATKEAGGEVESQAEFIQVRYARVVDLANLLRGEAQTFLSDQGKLMIDERTNTLVVQDTAERRAAVRALITRLDVPVKQVLIESRIVIADDNFERALGLQWGAHRNTASIIGRAGDREVGSMPESHRANTVSAWMKVPGDLILDLELTALESEGLGKIISSPRLVTSNQQKAYIESGEEIPYQESTASGATSVSFKKAVLRLEVIPQITEDETVLLDLLVNHDSRGVETAGVPAIHKQEIHTRVLVKNGETIVLGGIYQHTKRREVVSVPFLGRLPGIGWMFRYKSDKKHRSELMIFVTPKIIQEQGKIS
jgi:type IV pilus assembly protein PilQ